MPSNLLGDRLLRQHQETISPTRRVSPQFSVQNYERKLNDFASRVSSNKSQQLAIVQGLGLGTQGLIIGGIRSVSSVPLRIKADVPTGAISQRRTAGTTGSAGRDTSIKPTQRGGQRSGQLDPD